jgi:hypothetical protein
MLSISCRHFIGLIGILLCFNNSKAFQSKPGTLDTTFLKKTNYKKLDEFVSYFIINEGRHTNNKNLMYSFKQISDYYYLNHQYVIRKDNKEIIGSSTDLKKLIQSGKFSDRADFHGIFKINSKIALRLNPNILKRMSIFPKINDIKNAHILMNKLKKEKFVSGLALDSIQPFSIIRHVNKVKKRIYIRMVVNSKYRDIKKLGVISDQLKKWTDVEEVVYTQLFTGMNETNSFFEVTSKIGVLKKKSSDPFKSFVDSLKQN